MGDIDNTRDRLKLDELNKDARKDLFNKFVDAGGEVVTDKKKVNTGVVGGSSRRNANTLVGNDSKGSKGANTSGGAKSDINSANNSNSTAVAVKQKNSGLLFNLKLWFDAVGAGVITFMGGNVNPKFLNFIDKNIISAFLEMDTLIFNALNPTEATDIDAKTKHQKIIARGNRINTF